MPNLHFLNFLRPVATVTDKLIRASPYHGCRVRVIAFCLAFPVHSFDCLWFNIIIVDFIRIVIVFF